MLVVRGADCDRSNRSDVNEAEVVCGGDRSNGVVIKSERQSRSVTMESMGPKDDLAMGSEGEEGDWRRRVRTEMALWLGRVSTGWWLLGTMEANILSW